MKNNLDQMARELTGKKEKNILIFINALKKCLKKDSFEKISVSDIVAAAGRSRQTFYRSCDNKYDLVNKYLGMIILSSYWEMEKGKSLLEALTLKFRIMESEKDLFSQTFLTNDYESLHRYTHRLISSIYLDLHQKKSKVEPDKTRKLLLDMHCEESIYITIKWSRGEIENTPEEMAELLCDAMPAKLKGMYKEYL